MDRSYHGRRPQRHGGGGGAGGGGGGNRGGHQKKVLPPMHAYLDKHTLVILSGPAPAPAQTKDAKQAAYPVKLSGVLRGFDMYNNLVLENAVDESHPGIKTELGEIVIRGERVHSLELIVKPFEFGAYGGGGYAGVPV